MPDDLLTTTRDDLRAWDVPPRAPLVAIETLVAAPDPTSPDSRGDSSSQKQPSQPVVATSDGPWSDAGAQSIRANDRNRSSHATAARLPDCAKVSTTGGGLSGQFTALACRGFSYRFTIDPAFVLAFPRRINLRFSLALAPGLPHPPGVQRALRWERCRHVTSDHGRSAAFALGVARHEYPYVCWYVLALQSDLSFSRRPALRRYLRGWRKVLFACIACEARARGVTHLFLSPSAEVYRAALKSPVSLTSGVPTIWRHIYDETAAFFSMTLVNIKRPVNIQLLPRRRAVWSHGFYATRLVAAQPKNASQPGVPSEGT
jgi:hypothetical protein